VSVRQQLPVKAPTPQLELVSTKQREHQTSKADFLGKVYTTFRWPAQLGGKEVSVVGGLMFVSCMAVEIVIYADASCMCGF
jgi:hypothetical protein